MKRIITLTILLILTIAFENNTAVSEKKNYLNNVESKILYLRYHFPPENFEWVYKVKTIVKSKK